MADRSMRSRTPRDGFSSFQCAEILCTSNDFKQKNYTKWRVMFCLVVAIASLLFAIFESAMNLPQPSSKRSLFGNLNMAKLHPLAQPPLRKSNNLLQTKTDSGSNVSLTNNVAPPATWPVNFKEETIKRDMETLLHPGDRVTKMTVPKFWSPPLHNQQFYAREQAMQVGTCVEPNENGDHVRGDACPLDKRTIFLAIASYRDFQCRETVESAFSRAKHPERIRVGVVDQIASGEDVNCDNPVQPCEDNPNQPLCKYRDQIDVYKMPAHLSVGPTVARHIGDRLYRGEYYAAQTDAHVTFVQSWDEDIVSQLEATHNEMAVLTMHLADVQGSIDQNGKSLRHTRPITCNAHYERDPQGSFLRYGAQPDSPPSVHGSPQLVPWWAAGFSFSRGHFIVNVPHDWYQPMIIKGEAMSIGIRGWSVGYDYYAPERSVSFHHYVFGKNAKVRNKVKHFWENSDRYPGTGEKAMARLLGIVHMNPEVDPSKWEHTEEDVYGLGSVRTPEKFYSLFGIDVVKKTAQGHLCMLVDAGKGKMHKMFTPKLRPDGMGIDYDKISYQWKDPRPDPKAP